MSYQDFPVSNLASTRNSLLGLNSASTVILQSWGTIHWAHRANASHLCQSYSAAAGLTQAAASALWRQQPVCRSYARQVQLAQGWFWARGTGWEVGRHREFGCVPDLDRMGDLDVLLLYSRHRPKEPIGVELEPQFETARNSKSCGQWLAKWVIPAGDRSWDDFTTLSESGEFSRGDKWSQKEAILRKESIQEWRNSIED